MSTHPSDTSTQNWFLLQQKQVITFLRYPSRTTLAHTPGSSYRRFASLERLQRGGIGGVRLQLTFCFLILLGGFLLFYKFSNHCAMEEISPQWQKHYVSIMFGTCYPGRGLRATQHLVQQIYKCNICATILVPMISTPIY